MNPRKFWIAAALTLLALTFAPVKALGSPSREAVIESIIKAADLVDVPRELVLAVCWVESSHRSGLPPKQDGGSLSHGICQVKLETARDMDLVFKHQIKATPKRLQNDFVNAFYAAKYLKYQLKRYNGDWRLACDAYNKGSARSVRTQYVKRVEVAMRSYAE